MRKPILLSASALLVLSAFSSLPSYAGLDAWSNGSTQQTLQGSSESSSSSYVSNNRLYEDLPPLAKSSTNNSNTVTGSSGSSSGGGGHAGYGVATSNTSGSPEVHAKTDSYVWLK